MPLKQVLRRVIPQPIRTMIADWRRSLRPKYQPPSHITRDVWEKEYAGGQWDYLEKTNELARYGVIASYCADHKPGSAILDIGCGTGILARRLEFTNYAGYLGVDLSDKAVEIARKDAPPKAQFEISDVDAFPLQQTFDIIIFNEVIYYLDDPLKTLRRYAEHLAPDGIIIISVFTTPQNLPVWDVIEDFAPLQDAVKLENLRSYLTWTVKVYSKPQA